MQTDWNDMDRWCSLFGNSRYFREHKFDLWDAGEKLVFHVFIYKFEGLHHRAHKFFPFGPPQAVSRVFDAEEFIRNTMFDEFLLHQL